MIFILSNKEREDKDYEEKYRIGKELFEADMLVICLLYTSDAADE